MSYFPKLQYVHFFRAKFKVSQRVLSKRWFSPSIEVIVVFLQASELGMSIPERPAQLLLLQDSLIKLKDFRVGTIITLNDKH